jgi:hypothetical protein
MEGFNHSRRDDLESLAYSFMLLIDSSKVTWSSETDKTSILKKKREFIERENSLLPVEF